MEEDYGGQVACSIDQSMEAKQAYDPRRATVRQRLQQQLADLKKQQDQIEKALAALDKIPDVEVLLDLLRKVGV